MTERPRAISRVARGWSGVRIVVVVELLAVAAAAEEEEEEEEEDAEVVVASPALGLEVWTGPEMEREPAEEAERP